MIKTQDHLNKNEPTPIITEPDYEGPIKPPPPDEEAPPPSDEVEEYSVALPRHMQEWNDDAFADLVALTDMVLASDGMGCGDCMPLPVITAPCYDGTVGQADADEAQANATDVTSSKDGGAA